MIWHWFLHYTGSNNESGPWYGFWSGFGSDLGEVTIIGSLITLYRRGTCHEPVRIPVIGRYTRCWRHGHHEVPGTPYKACRKHHPALPAKARPGDIARAYRKARESQ